MAAIRFIFLVCVLGTIFPGTLAQKITIGGYVRDASSKEALIGANVYDTIQQRGTTTNQYGYYSLTLQSGDSVSLVISYVGYKPVGMKTLFDENMRTDFLLTSSNELEEVEINASRNDDNVNKTRVGVVTVPMRELRNLPVLMGERDILKIIQLLPGVQQAQEGTTGFYVRGGNLDQNLVQLDGATVYNPNHLFGLVSTFNINAVNHVELIKGGFPAEYGGRLSSILDITLRDGSKEKFQGEGGIGLISSNLTFEGPIKENKASFIVSARRSYIDLIQKAFIPDNTTLYSFYDINAKANFEIGSRDRLFISAFNGRDNGSYTGPSSLNYGIGFGNGTATVRWNHLFGSNMFTNTSLIVNAYDLGLSTEQGTYYSLFYTGIHDINGKTDVSWFADTEHVVKFGASYFHHTLFPATYSDQIPKSGNRVKIDPDLIERAHANAMAVYVSHEWDPSGRVGINYGIRVPYYAGGNKDYTYIEPRLTVRLSIDASTSVKASWTVMNQFLHAVPYSSASLPVDIWIASGKDVQPQQSVQYSLGVFKNLRDNEYEVSVEGYHKEMKNQVLFKEGTQLNTESDLAANLTFGEGLSYGGELLLKKNTGRLTGWFGYTWSKTTQTFPDMNFGNPFPFTYDRRHNLSVVGTYDINERWSMSADFVFRTGSAFTLPTGRIPVTDGTLYDGWYYDFTTRNNARQRSYHRLDVSFSYKKARKFFGHVYQSEWVFGCYNVYSRKNPYFVYLTVDPLTEQPEARQVSLLPIIPSVSYNFKF
ncbi:MAG: TonB-dependent receptor [Cyclobacteriaceae bacterium]